MVEYNHDMLVRKLDEKLRDKFETAELIARKGGSEFKLGRLRIERRHFSGESGAPDFVLFADSLQLLNKQFAGSVPLALLEIEKTIGDSMHDLRSYADSDREQLPVLLITESEMGDRIKTIPGKSTFRILTKNYDEI
ncbi:hypothetical protein [Haloquadratum walsbyi]|uniref:Uncharacterized protein n=1 Tax=Haloquadratum walsbyi (strain DSM 16854 / JCM 12705 / C23) TaxID=768065 RepID=G0LN94_HALWC|nr:hypothetical protein [Haloquadratum walsbyi]CCC41900.1 uncharacterized protein Hqrw_5024 [Haloquadratum walsbyi C23]